MFLVVVVVAVVVVVVVVVGVAVDPHEGQQEVDVGSCCFGFCCCYCC